MIYEDLVKNYPFDHRRHFVEFCLAKTLLAQRDKGPSFAERAQSLLERLYATNITNPQLQLEITATYCFVLFTNDRADILEDIAWKTLLMYMESKKTLSPDEVHWLEQLVLILEKCYSGESSTDIKGETLQQIKNQLRQSE